MKGAKDHARNNFPFCRPIAPHLRLLLNRGIQRHVIRRFCPLFMFGASLSMFGGLASLSEYDKFH